MLLKCSYLFIFLNCNYFLTFLLFFFKDFAGSLAVSLTEFIMITPAFELSQDPDFLTITIKVPYARVSEFEVYFEGKEFKFYAKPYFLR